MRASRRIAVVAGLGVAMLTGCQGAGGEAQASASTQPSPTPELAVLDDRPLDDQLFDAVRAGDAALAQLAVDAGADVNHLRGQNSALDIAVTRDDAVMAAILLEAGATHTREDGLSVLSLAGEFAGPDVIRALIEAGADPNGAGEFVGAPMNSAAYAGNLPALQVLLDAGAWINQPTENFNVTPLAAAAFGNDLATVEFLVSYGADPTILLADGNTAGQWAAAQGHLEVARYLNELVENQAVD